MRKRQLLLAALDYTRPKDPPISLGAASIIANLNTHKIDNQHKAWAVNQSSFHPDLVVKWVQEAIQSSKYNRSSIDFGIGAFVWNENHIQYILNRLKEMKFAGRIIVGGPQISYVSQNLEPFYPQADIFVRGYAEDAMVKIMEQNDHSPIRGVHFKGGLNTGVSANTNLEQLTSPFLSGVIGPQNFIRWETQRGCPFSCSFCQHRESKDGSKEATVRRPFSLDRVQREANWITSNPNINDIAVLDPTFNSGPVYLKVLDYLLIGGYKGNLSLQCRAEMVRPEFLEKIRLLNENGANVVLEFGIQTIHKNEQITINRINNLKKVEKVLADCHQKKIRFEITLIFGLPHQTLETFQSSINWGLSQNPGKLLAFPLMLLRGTPLYDQKEKLGLVESSDLPQGLLRETELRQSGNIPHVISSPSFTVQEWTKMSELADILNSS